MTIPLTQSSVSKSYLYFAATAAALGGILFGFDIAVINGALVFLRKQFMLSDAQTELAASSLLAGCVIGASLAGGLSDRFGRKKVLLGAAVLFLVSSLGAAIPQSLSGFVSARVIGGLAIGMESMLAPLYLAEISPARLRGRLVSLHQLAIVGGILVAYFVSWTMTSLGDNAWRWMFASAVVPSFLFVLAFLTAPESPRWLVKQGRPREAYTILEKIGEDAPARLRDIEVALAEEGGSWSELLAPALRKPMQIAVALAILQQITGINTILFYGSLLLTEHVSGQTATSALGANVLIGIVNVLATIVAIGGIDRLGRKPLLMAASGGMGVCMFLLGIVLWLAPGAVMLIIGLILTTVACFGIGMGPGVWVMMSELFPTRVRGRAMSVATISLWSACVLLTFTFLTLMRAISATGAFWVYASICGFTFWFIWKRTPETKGKTLEEIEHSWLRH
jgi:sugar porter (SP) family MFS transporter